MVWKVGDPKPRRNGRVPHKESDVTCLWCDDNMKGKSYFRHAQSKQHEYLS